MNSQAKTVVLIPPRPNLGPEPYDAAAPVWPWVVAIGAAIVTVGVIRWMQAPSQLAKPARNVEAELASSVAPEVRMARLSAAVRQCLAARFDESWLAKTTEEIEAVVILGDEDVPRLIAFLHAADLVKFARREGQGDDLEAWLAWASSFVADGASSKRIGK